MSRSSLVRDRIRRLHLYWYFHPSLPTDRRSILQPLQSFTSLRIEERQQTAILTPTTHTTTGQYNILLLWILSIWLFSGKLQENVCISARTINIDNNEVALGKSNIQTILWRVIRNLQSGHCLPLPVLGTESLVCSSLLVVFLTESREFQVSTVRSSQETRRLTDSSSDSPTPTALSTSPPVSGGCLSSRMFSVDISLTDYDYTVLVEVRVARTEQEYNEVEEVVNKRTGSIFAWQSQ